VRTITAKLRNHSAGHYRIKCHYAYAYVTYARTFYLATERLEFVAPRRTIVRRRLSPPPVPPSHHPSLPPSLPPSLSPAHSKLRPRVIQCARITARRLRDAGAGASLPAHTYRGCVRGAATLSPSFGMNHRSTVNSNFRRLPCYVPSPRA